MSEKGLAGSAVEMATTSIMGNRATKGIQSLPNRKQNKISGILKFAVAVMVIISGIKMLKNRTQTG